MGRYVTTRAETHQWLSRWIAGEVGPVDVWRWAVAQKEIAAQSGPEDALVRDIIDVLADLPQDLLIVEDAEVMIYGLENPPDEADLSQNLLWNHIDGIDTDARRRSLRDDE